MREIKFRGKSTISIEELDAIGIKHDSGWVCGNLITNGDKSFIVGDIAEMTEEYINHEWWVTVNPETVGQYTGMNDANDWEIYEGDIVEIAHPEIRRHQEEFKERGQILFDSTDGKFKWKEPDSGVLYGLVTNDEANEIIGSIHDNPDLLKAGASE